MLLSILQCTEQLCPPPLPPPTKNYSGQNVDSGKVEEAWLIVKNQSSEGKQTQLKSSSCAPCACAQSLSRVVLFATPWTLARQASLSMEFSRQEYWSWFTTSFFRQSS